MSKEIFNSEFSHLLDQKIDLNTILKEDMILINGNFYGIQNFIFKNLSTKKASKVLRAKSAYVQIFTKVLAFYIIDILGIDEKNILISSAGKIEILSNNIDQSKIDILQEQLDEFFIDKFFALSGVSLISLKCKKDDLLDKDRFKILREKLEDQIELKKFNRFNIKEQNCVMKNHDTSRREFTRAELLGRIGMIKSSQRFNLNLIENPNFLHDIYKIQTDENKDELVIKCSKEEFDSFEGL